VKQKKKEENDVDLSKEELHATQIRFQSFSSERKLGDYFQEYYFGDFTPTATHLHGPRKKDERYGQTT
jgi:hypothetical protein